ncbi:MAG: hypothetical protein ACLU0O_02175 [Collinsella sp.]
MAIDRVFATNNDLAVGDKVELEGRTYTICGIMTQPDSQALFLNNSDFTVNTITYGVAEVTDAGFAALEDAGGAPAYTYSFTFTDRDLPTADRIDAEQDMVEALTDADARVDDLIDADSNQGIGYARDDVDGDSMMWMTLLDIIIVIMAFVFVVLTDATIEEESAIIGTLLASGYRREIVLHYLALPPSWAWSRRFGHCARRCVLYRAHAQPLLRFVQPAALPGVLELGDLCEVRRGSAVALILITLVGCFAKWARRRCSSFVTRRRQSGTKRGLQLPERMGFVSRFRLRIFLRNLGNFATLFVGIAFARCTALWPGDSAHDDALRGQPRDEPGRRAPVHAQGPLELEGTAEEREQWSALERLQSVDGALLSPPRMPMTSLTMRPMRRRRRPMPRPSPVCREPPRAGRACQGPGQEGCALRASMTLPMPSAATATRLST